MKKHIWLLLISVCLLTGCTKQYSSVSEYSTDMNKVRNKLGDYTIEATISSNDVNGYYKSFIKNNKWRAEGSKDNGNTYNTVILYDGNKVYAYEKNKNIAIDMPIKEMLKQSNVDNEKAEFVMKFINPMGILIYWDLDNISGNIDGSWQIGTKSKKNGFDCRMISYKLSPSDEVCVSDKYGIAVYAKLTTKTKHGVMEINVKNIDNTPISEQEFELPSEMRVYSMMDLLKGMLKK